MAKLILQVSISSLLSQVSPKYIYSNALLNSSQNVVLVVAFGSMFFLDRNLNNKKNYQDVIWNVFTTGSLYDIYSHKGSFWLLWIFVLHKVISLLKLLIYRS